MTGPTFYLCTCAQVLGDDLRRAGCVLWWCSPQLCGCDCHQPATTASCEKRPL